MRMDMTINFKLNKKVTDLKQGDTIYIKKMIVSGHQVTLLCEFIKIERGLIIAKILDGEPEWAIFRDLAKGTIIKSFKKNTFLWGSDKDDKWDRCHWYNKEKKIYE